MAKPVATPSDRSRENGFEKTVVKQQVVVTRACTIFFFFSASVQVTCLIGQNKERKLRRNGLLVFSWLLRKIDETKTATLCKSPDLAADSWAPARVYK